MTTLRRIHRWYKLSFRRSLNASDIFAVRSLPLGCFHYVRPLSVRVRHSLGGEKDPREEDAVILDHRPSCMTVTRTWGQSATFLCKLSITFYLEHLLWRWRPSARSKPCRSSCWREEGGSNRWSWSIISDQFGGQMTSRRKALIARLWNAPWTAWVSWQWRTAWNLCV